MRQMAPVSPALHLGADRVLIVGTGRQNSTRRARAPASPVDRADRRPRAEQHLPDSLAVDIERLERINRTVRLVPPDRLTTRACER